MYSKRFAESRAVKNDSGIPINSKIRKKKKMKLLVVFVVGHFEIKILVEKSLQKRHGEGEKKTFFGNEKYLSGIL